KDKEALEAWEALRKTSPDDKDIPMNIASILIRQKRYAEAVVELEPIADEEPTNPRVLLELGDAYLHIGKTEKVSDLLKNALGKNPSDNTLNEVAYELADNNLQLDDALKYATEAVDKIEDDASDITFDDLL